MLMEAAAADVMPRTEDTLVLLYPVDSEEQSRDLVTASFDSEWKDKVRKLHRGERIKIYGIISELPNLSLGLSLEHCKLMTQKLVPDL